MPRMTENSTLLDPTHFPRRRPDLTEPPAIRTPPKILLPHHLQPGNPAQATNAARSLSEFIADQLKRVRKRGRPKRHPYSTKPLDTRLWFDERHYAAWTTNGELVTIELRRPGYGASPVRLAAEEEILLLKAANRLIDQMISLYPGDSLATGTVFRFIPDFRLELALQAAHARALADETELDHELSEEEAPTGTVHPLKKSRFRPLGNFIIYRDSPPAAGQPLFAIDTLGKAVPSAFEDRRQASRYINTRTRRGQLPEGCRAARVLARAMVSTIVRDGFRRPRSSQKFIEQVRLEPRLVDSELEVVWLPRYKQGKDGSWHLEEFKAKRTVRHGVTRRILAALQSCSAQAMRMLEQEEIASHINEPRRFEESSVLLDLQPAMDRAQRRLPSPWREQLGLDGIPYWSDLHQNAKTLVEDDQAHWIRAPFEYGRPLRSRLVELRIDDLAGLLEEHGLEIEFWLISDEIGGEPRWVLPLKLASR